MENYIGSQQHWEDSINDDYDQRDRMQKDMEKEISKQIDQDRGESHKELVFKKRTGQELIDRIKELGLENSEIVIICDKGIPYSIKSLERNYEHPLNFGHLNVEEFPED